MTLYPGTLDDLSDAAAGQALGAKHLAEHALYNSAHEQEQLKLGTGASVPTTVGHVLTVTGAGATAYAAPAASSERAAASSAPPAIGTAAVGVGTTDARADHVHATGAGTPSTQAFGDAAAVGTGPAASMTDHKHAMPADPVTAHAAAGDPHAGYRLETESPKHTRASSAPGSPATGDRWTDSDNNIEFFWDGTRWLSVQLFSETLGSPGALAPITTTGTFGQGPTWGSLFDLWLVDAFIYSMVATTNNGTNYWNLALNKFDGTTVAAVALRTTAADTADVHYTNRVAINALLGTANVLMWFAGGIVLAPGALTAGMRLTYRLVG